MSTNTVTQTDQVTVESIEDAAKYVYAAARHTPLEYSDRLSKRYGAKVYLKREDQQVVRSYKIRGAYTLMRGLSAEQQSQGVVTASAGNHAQGVAYAAAQLKLKATIYMPAGTPLQKIRRVRHFGGKWVETRLVGKTFDDSLYAALKFTEEHGGVFVHPFNDPRVISGQGTVGIELLDQLTDKLDVVVAPIGGGGLVSGLGTYLKAKLPKMKLIGVEPAGAPAMHQSIQAGKLVRLEGIDKFVDGAAVQCVGNHTLALASKLVNEVVVVPEGKTCTTMVELYQNEGIIAEPAGALAVSALDQLKDQIKDKTVVVIISGGNNDLLRYPEIIEKSLTYEGLKHYLLVEFDQKPGQLRQFVTQALGENDDITRFEYIKKTNKDNGTALVGIEVAERQDFPVLLSKLSELGVAHKVLSQGDLLYDFMV